MKVKISEVKQLLEQGKKVKIKTIKGKFCNVSKFVEKGNLDTYLVELENGKSIKTSDNHRFFSNIGWICTKHLITGKTKILCDDESYSTVKKIEYIGKNRIVDLSVDDEHSYFGNGILNHNSGKSLLAYMLLKSCKDQGGIPVLIDTEASADLDFLTMLGLEPKKNLIYIQVDSIEDVFTAIEETIRKIRETNKDKLCCIVWDSIASTSVKQELENDFGSHVMGLHARMIGQGLRKIVRYIAQQDVALIFLNQLRYKMNASPFADPYCVCPLTTKIKI